jgi:hypothetical protein
LNLNSSSYLNHPAINLYLSSSSSSQQATRISLHISILLGNWTCRYFLSTQLKMHTKFIFSKFYLAVRKRLSWRLSRWRLKKTRCFFIIFLSISSEQYNNFLSKSSNGWFLKNLVQLSLPSSNRLSLDRHIFDTFEQIYAVTVSLEFFKQIIPKLFENISQIFFHSK